MSHDYECRYPDGFHSCIKYPCADCPWGLCNFGCGHNREDCACPPDEDEHDDCTVYVAGHVTGSSGFTAWFVYEEGYEDEGCVDGPFPTKAEAQAVADKMTAAERPAPIPPKATE